MMNELITYEDFTEKLAPFFTGEQIIKLNEAAMESAIDANGEKFEYGAAGAPDFGIVTSQEEMHAMGREVILIMLADNAEDREYIEQLAGSPMTAASYSDFYRQVCTEW